MLQIVVEVVCDADCGFTVLACAYFMCVLLVAEIKYVYVCMYVWNPRVSRGCAL